MNFNLIIADPCWNFSDKLNNDPNIKRGAESQYSTMSSNDIINLDVKSIAADNSILALWVPGSLLQVGLDTMKNWGFEQKQVYVWVKTKKAATSIKDCLSFGMGRLFRQTHEIALIGTRGKVYSSLENKSQRSVEFGVNEGHSIKPNSLHESLELMFPSYTNRLELFARREKEGWTTVGNECPGEFLGKDIREAIEILKNR